MGPLTKQLELTDVEISWIFNIFNVVYDIMLFTTGPLVQEFGFRKVATLSPLVAAFGYCLMIFANSAIYLILVFGIVIGELILKADC